jgi:serine-type D-Ala-D-Ala carboxypeptidase (penicillin-binding protein 5/6)
MRHLLTLLMLAFALPVAAFDTKATAAWVYDVKTGTVLMDKNGEVPLPPASMSKLMTINMLLEALQDGRVTMDTTFAVSERAKAMGGSRMFLDVGDQPTVRDLLHGMIVNSGNDACVVVAEGLAGTEEAFAAQMTERARALGMDQSTFRNATGWPAEGHMMSMRDLGLIANRLISEFPQEYAFFAETEYSWQGRAPDNRFNRNPILGSFEGADGLKTGHTQEAGYGLVGSAMQGDRRVIFAITGLASDADRASESERILSWAFRQFAEKTLADQGVRVATAEVWMGDAATVGLVPAADATFLVPALVQESVTAEVVYTGPLRAPIAAGSEVAELVIHIPDLPDARVPLVAETDVGRAGFAARVMTAAGALWQTYVVGAPEPSAS